MHEAKENKLYQKLPILLYSQTLQSFRVQTNKGDTFTTKTFHAQLSYQEKSHALLKT